MRHCSGRACPETAGRLRRARETRGLTQTEAARAVGVSLETIQNWEAARSEPKASQVRDLARAYDTTPGKLLDPAPVPA